MIYCLYKTIDNENAAYVFKNTGETISFIFDPANTDYAEFKKAVMEGAELQDADGNVMTADEAKQFIGTLP